MSVRLPLPGPLPSRSFAAREFAPKDRFAFEHDPARLWEVTACQVVPPGDVRLCAAAGGVVRRWVLPAGLPLLAARRPRPVAVACLLCGTQLHRIRDTAAPLAPAAVCGQH